MELEEALLHSCIAQGLLIICRAHTARPLDIAEAPLLVLVTQVQEPTSPKEVALLALSLLVSSITKTPEKTQLS